MHWISTAALGDDLDALLEEVTRDVRAGLGDAGVDLVFVFLGADLAGGAERVLEVLRERLGAEVLLGCTAGGVIGGDREFEDRPALSVLAGRLPEAGIHAFHLGEADLPDADASPGAWQESLGLSSADDPAFVLIGDPFSMDASRLLAGLDFAYPEAVKVGGLASGARRPGEQVLLLNDRVIRDGAVGIGLMGNARIVPAVAQGCRALGGAMRITACEGHLLTQVDGRPILEALQGVMGEASEHDRRLASHTLSLGFEMDPLVGTSDDAPWLIRNLVGIDPTTRGLYVGEELRRGRRVRFHVRDRVTSAEDLDRTLEAALSEDATAPAAALLFSCLGRGTHLYGTPDHDTLAFRERVGQVPLGGFFCSGEIGPVGGTTHLHGFTSAFGLIGPS